MLGNCFREAEDTERGALDEAAVRLDSNRLGIVLLLCIVVLLVAGVASVARSESSRVVEARVKSGIFCDSIEKIKEYIAELEPLNSNDTAPIVEGCETIYATPYALAVAGGIPVLRWYIEPHETDTAFYPIVGVRFLTGGIGTKYSYGRVIQKDGNVHGTSL